MPLGGEEARRQYCSTLYDNKGGGGRYHRRPGASTTGAKDSRRRSYDCCTTTSRPLKLCERSFCHNNLALDTANVALLSIAAVRELHAQLRTCGRRTMGSTLLPFARQSTVDVLDDSAGSYVPPVDPDEAFRPQPQPHSRTPPLQQPATSRTQHSAANRPARPPSVWLNCVRCKAKLVAPADAPSVACPSCGQARDYAPARLLRSCDARFRCVAGDDAAAARHATRRCCLPRTVRLLRRRPAPAAWSRRRRLRRLRIGCALRRARCSASSTTGVRQMALWPHTCAPNNCSSWAQMLCPHCRALLALPLGGARTMLCGVCCNVLQI